MPLLALYRTPQDTHRAEWAIAHEIGSSRLPGCRQGLCLQDDPPIAPDSASASPGPAEVGCSPAAGTCCHAGRHVAIPCPGPHWPCGGGPWAERSLAKLGRWLRIAPLLMLWGQVSCKLSRNVLEVFRELFSL